MAIAVKQFPLAPLSFLADKIPNEDRIYLSEYSGLIIDTSSLYDGPDAQKSILNSALTSIKKKSSFEQIRAEYPSLYTASINMASYFTQLANAEGGMTLLSKCLLHGINAFFEAHQHSYLSNNPAIKMSAFIEGASSSFHEIMFSNIYGQYEDSWVQWKPLTEPIYDWVLRYQFKRALIVPTSTKVSAASYNAASNKLLYAIFDFSDLSFCGISSAQGKILASA